MTDVFELYEDNGTTPITKDTLNTKSLEELMKIFEDILEEAQKLI
jgi:hypothetical protein